MPVEGGETRLRLVLIGSGGSKSTGPGKSTLIERYLSGKYISPLMTTSGVDTKTKQLIIKGRAFNRRLSIQFMEMTSNETNLASLAPSYLSKCDAVVYVYDSTDHKSFEALESLRQLVSQYIKSHIGAILFATKCDLEHERQVTSMEASQLARRFGIQLFETSAMTGMNVEAAVLSIIRTTAIRIAMAYADTGLVDSLMTLVVPSPLISTPDDSGTLSFSEEGFTAIHYACRFGGHDVLKSLLLRKDVDINSTDAKGRTALHIATIFNQMKCVRALLKAGADVTLVDRVRQNTALAIAEKEGRTELHTLLTKAHTSFLFNEAMKAGAMAPRKCKLIILGSSGSGKTSLWRGLRGLPRKDSTGRLMRTLLFESTTILLSELETLPDLHEGEILTPNSHTMVPRRRTQHIRSDSTSSDGSNDGADHSCQSFTVTLFQTLLGFRRRQAAKQAAQLVNAYEVHPLASPESYPQDDAGEVTINCWDIAGQDSAAPLQPTLMECHDVVIICFDLVKAQFGREEMLKELTYWFSLLDSQEHRPGTPRATAGIVNLRRGSSNGDFNIYQRHDILLVGTFQDSLTINGASAGPAAQQEKARLLEDISIAICQRLGHLESFARLRLPHLTKGRVFYAVGTDISEADDLGSLRRSLCKAVIKNGALRRSRPTMWLRFLEELRSVPAGGSNAAQTSSSSSSSSSSPSYRHAISYEQAKQIANKIAYEYTNRPMAPSTFQLMLKLLGEMGEIVTLGTDVVIPRKDYVLRVYQKLVEKCRAMELSPRKRGSATNTTNGHGSSSSIRSPPQMTPFLQYLRTSGSLEMDHLKQLLGSEDGPYMDICLRALDALDLAYRMNAGGSSIATTLLTSSLSSLSLSSFGTAPSSSSSSMTAFFPAFPLSMNEEHFTFPVESPNVYDELSGKVICYYSFHELVPTGLLSRLVLAGIRPKVYDIGGLKFSYHHWGQPVLARDHVEIAQDGYTLSLTVDHRRARISCALACQDGYYLTPGMEAQIGLMMYDMLEVIRKEHYARFKMDLLVVEDGRIYDFVTDILLVHKAGERLGAAAAPDAATPDHPSDVGGGKNKANHHGTARGQEEEGEGAHHFDFGGILSDTMKGSASPTSSSYLPHVVHWAMIMTSAPMSSFKPLPSALIHGTMASANARSARLLQSWAIRPPTGRLCVSLPDGRRAVLAIHPGGPRRRSKNSAYVALVEERDVMAVQAYWRLESVKGGFHIRVAEEVSSGQHMGGWYLGLTSRGSSSSKANLHVIINQDPTRAAVWSTDGVDGGYIRIRWRSSSSSGSNHAEQYRYLTEGAKDARAPHVRLVVVGGAAHRRPWNFSVVDASDIAASQYISPRQQSHGNSKNPRSARRLGGGGSVGGVGGGMGDLHSIALELPVVHVVVKVLLKEMIVAVIERLTLASVNAAADTDEEGDDGAAAAVIKTASHPPQRRNLLLLRSDEDDEGCISSSLGEEEEEEDNGDSPKATGSTSSSASSSDDGGDDEEEKKRQTSASAILSSTSVSLDLSQSEVARSFTML